MMTFGLRPRLGTVIVGGELSANSINQFNADALALNRANINQVTLSARVVKQSANSVQTTLKAEACPTNI